MKIVSFGHAQIECQGIAFDKDGTLIDIFSMLSALGNERYQHLARKVGEEALTYYQKCAGFHVETKTVEPFGPLASARRSDEIAVAACALWLAGIPWFKSYEIAKEAYDEADLTLDPTEGVRLLPGVREALEVLSQRGIPLFIITSDGHERTERMLTHLGLKDLFRKIVGADDVKETKPSPEALVLCSESIKADPKNIVVVGDAPQDALMAKKASARSVGVLTGVSPRETLTQYFDFVIGGVKDIRPL